MKRTRLKRSTKRIPKVSSRNDAVELDKLARQIVMIRDGFRCRRCNKGIRGDKANRLILQSHHIRPKGSSPALRWELDNLLCVCSWCHMFFFHSRDPYEVAQWYLEHLGTEHMEHLGMMNRVRKGKKVDRGAVKLYLESILARIPDREEPS
jgi:hypothetical protein